MSRKLNKEEKIAFIESLDDLSREEKDRLLYELAQIDDLSEIIEFIPPNTKTHYRAFRGV